MKRILLFIPFCLLFLSSNAQNCMMESNLPPDFLGVWPVGEEYTPCDTIVPDVPAYIDEPYEFTYTAFVPDIFQVSGLDIELYNVTIDAVYGIPQGLSYVCEPPDCIFPGGEGGCLKLTGTPSSANAPGIHELDIQTTVNTSFGFPLPVSFPPSEDPDSNLIELPQCPYVVDLRVGTPTQDLFEEQVSVSQNTPNPFTGITNIEVNAEVGDYTFSVYNLLGERVHTRDVRLNGEDIVQFDGTGLDSGVYIYSFANENGSISKRMVIK
jgi:hypothetical protein